MIALNDPLLIIPSELLTLVLDFLESATLFSLSMTAEKYTSNKIIHSARIRCKQSVLDNLERSLDKGVKSIDGLLKGQSDYELDADLAKKIIHFSAISYEYIDLFKWLVRPDEIMYMNDSSYTRHASHFGCLEILKYLHESGCPWDSIACVLAAGTGKIDVLKYLHENGRPWNEYECMYAAMNDQIECLKYLHENGCKWDQYTCLQAAIHNSIESLKYLIENGCDCDNWVFRCAASSGSLDVLKYLYEIGYMDPSACKCAATNGHLEVVKFLCENKCPYDEDDVITGASDNGHSEVVKYLHDHGCSR